MSCKGTNSITVGGDQPPHIEEQSRSKGNVLQRQERRHEKGKRL